MPAHNIISAENEEGFVKFDPSKVIVEVSQASVLAAAQKGKGLWVNIKYAYDNKKDWLKIQTPELYANKIYLYDSVQSVPKLNFVISDRLIKEAEVNPNMDPNVLLNAKLEQETVTIFKQLIEKIKEELVRPNIVNLLQKEKDKKWADKVDSMEILKQEVCQDGSGTTLHFLNPKIVEKPNVVFGSTDFYTLTEDGIPQIMNCQETVKSFIENKTGCKGIAVIVVDSVFVGNEPFIQVKLKSFVITEKFEKSNNSTPQLVNRFKKTVISDDEA